MKYKNHKLDNCENCEPDHSAGLSLGAGLTFRKEERIAEVEEQRVGPSGIVLWLSYFLEYCQISTDPFQNSSKNVVHRWKAPTQIENCRAFGIF